MAKNGALIDYTDKELRDGLRNSATNVQFSYRDYREELLESSKDKNTKALNRWTIVIVIAITTFLNTLAVLIQLIKGGF